VNEIDRTHDASARSWVESANAPTTDFPPQNLPFGAFRLRGEKGPARCGVAVGDCVLDVSRVAEVFVDAASEVAAACGRDVLNVLMQLPHASQAAFRLQLFDLLTHGNSKGQELLTQALVSARDVDLVMPVRVAGYTDFFASVHHATNAGRLFRPDQPLLPNYKYVPVGYNGRAASVQVSGEPVQRPRGQLRKPGSEIPSFLPCERLDHEVELGLFIGHGSERGAPIAVSDAWSHVFGVCLLNDWSARDIQAWEAQPLGPFLAKSFATSISPWVVTTAALAPFHRPAASRPTGDPAPLPHLWDDRDQANGALHIEIDALLRTALMREGRVSAHHLSRSDSAALYWTPSQMLAHHTSNGSFLQSGDLIGTGTISGADDSALGSLLEITRGGQGPMRLPSGEERRFLEDGDELTLTARCERPGFRSIGFGQCCAIVVPSAPVREPLSTGA
jgi:fumarylacetoacetase